MLISPPFLLPRQVAETDEQFIARTMIESGGDAEGAFPVGAHMNWHGGVHLTAPLEPNGGRPVPVRAIADGTVLFVRQPTPEQSNSSHPLNYRGGWTDDGCVLIRHQNEIGANVRTRQLTSVTFYSIYLHLQEIPGSICRGVEIFRKEPLGLAGRIYSAPNRIHFEIICDDANVEKLTGRRGSVWHVAKGGRTDAIFGAIWFVLPVQTPFYPNNPSDRKELPSPAFHNEAPLAIRMIFRQGDLVVQAYNLLSGVPVADEIVSRGYEYGLMEKAHNLYPQSPAAGVDLLRFGRVPGPDQLRPADTQNWQEVATKGGRGWVDLNATSAVKVFSDADFPEWDAWRLRRIGAGDLDSRCRDPGIIDILDLNRDGKVTQQEVKTALQNNQLRKRLARSICKFSTEWESRTIERRFAWLRTGPSCKMNPTEFEQFKRHASALCFWEQAQAGIDASHWHFHSKEFILHFRKCGWIAAHELAQCIPKKDLKLSGTSFVRQSVANWQEALRRAQQWALDTNLTMRKYMISQTAQRILHFLAQVLAECTFLSQPTEGGGNRERYSPYWGRGLLHLTWKPTYERYGKYRGFARDPSVAGTQYKRLGWDPDRIIARNNRQFDSFNCADSAGFYWTNPSITPGRRNGLRTSDRGMTLRDIIESSKMTNGDNPPEVINGLEIRIQNFLYLKYVLLDQPRPASNIENARFTWRRNSQREPVLKPDGTPVLIEGKVKTKYYATTHSINVLLEHQRPGRQACMQIVLGRQLASRFSRPNDGRRSSPRQTTISTPWRGSGKIT